VPGTPAPAPPTAVLVVVLLAALSINLETCAFFGCRR
jgi:hypothetical protein